MKKILVILINILLCSSLGIIMPKLSSQEVDPTTETFVDDCGCRGSPTSTIASFNNEYYVMKSPINCTRLTITQLTSRSKETPEEFNWKDNDGVDWTTSAKNQGNCGSCWDFAALGALESRIKIMENCSQLQPDLSEQYILSCLPAAANNYGQGCLGGTPYGAYYYIINASGEGNNVNGIIPEWCFPYQASHTISCGEKCEEWMNHLIPLTDCNVTFLDLGYATKENTNIIKSIIYEEGPIAVALNVNQEFISYWNIHHSSDDYYPDTHEPWGNQLNHIVVLVGWKDDPTIQNGGYWIVKNSWGTDWGYEGFFNIEYYSLFIGMYYSTASYDPNSVNWGPIAPEINGPTSGAPGAEYEFKFTSIDPDGDDDIYYYIDWGDGLFEDWIGPYQSGESVEITHNWENKNNYNIRVKAKDTMGRESNWATLPVKIPYAYNPTHQFFDWLIQQFPNAFPILRQLLVY